MKIQSGGPSASGTARVAPEQPRNAESTSAASPRQGAPTQQTAPVPPFERSEFERDSTPLSESPPAITRAPVQVAAPSQTDGAFVDGGGRVVLAGSYKDVEPLVPWTWNATRPVLYVNGMTTPLETQQWEMRALADSAGYRVIGVRNETALKTEDRNDPRFWVAVAKDLSEAGLERLGVTHSRPARTIAKAVLETLDNGEAIHLCGQSQGAIMVASALWSVRRELIVGRGLSVEAAEAILRRVSVETFGSAQATFPDGPRYVHYVNDSDVIASTLGPNEPRPQASTELEVGPPPPQGSAGRGAVIVRFKSPDKDKMLAHMLPISLAYHRPFEEVWAEGQKRFAETGR